SRRLCHSMRDRLTSHSPTSTLVSRYRPAIASRNITTRVPVPTTAYRLRLSMSCHNHLLGETKTSLTRAGRPRHKVALIDVPRGTLLAVVIRVDSGDREGAKAEWRKDCREPKDHEGGFGMARWRSRVERS